MRMILLISALLTYGGIKGQTVKNFQLKNINNTYSNYSDLKGEKLTLIDFWATWCKPCLKAIPELNKIYELYKDKGVEIIGINCDGPQSASKVAPLSRSLQIKYPVLLDINADIKNDLNLVAFPSLIIVNSVNEIVWIHEGYVSGDEEMIRAEIDKNLNLN